MSTSSLLPRLRKLWPLVLLFIAFAGALLWSFLAMPPTSSLTQSAKAQIVSPASYGETPDIHPAAVVGPMLAGHVLSASGESIAGVTVSIVGVDGTVAVATTNSQGYFNAVTLAGPFIVKAEAKGFGAGLVHTVAPTTDLQITLFPGNVVQGKVMFEESRRPVAHARVVAARQPYRTPNELHSSFVKADAQGEFRFEDLAAGAWFLSVEGPDAHGALREPVHVTLDDEVRDLTLLVQPAAKVAGRFTVGDGDEPCRAGRVQFIPATLVRARLGSKLPQIVDSDELPNAVTMPIDSAGRFSIAALPLGEYSLGALCDEHQFVRGPPSFVVSEQPAGDLHFKFSAGLSLIATVRDEANRPIPSAAVALSIANEAGLSAGQIALARHSGLTDERGEYRFGGLRPGSYRVSAQYTALNGKARVEQIVAVQEGVTPQIDLTLPGAASIRIRARTQDGTPLSRMLFFAIDDKRTRYEAKYHGDGRFEIGPLPRNSYRVFAYDNKNAKVALQGGASISISDSDGVDMDFDYDLPDGQLVGRVVDHAGTPLSGTLVRAVSTTLDEVDEMYSFIQTGTHGAQELMTDAQGRFRIDGLNGSATYDLHVDHRSGLQEVRAGVAPGSFIEIAMPAGARILGRVVDSAGKPIPRFDVLASNARNGSRTQSFVDQRGFFALDNVVPGEVSIAIYDRSGDLSFEQAARLAPGQALDLGVVTLAAAPASD